MNIQIQQIKCDHCNQKYSDEIDWRFKPELGRRIINSIEEIYNTISLCEECFQKIVEGEGYEYTNI